MSASLQRQRSGRKARSSIRSLLWIPLTLAPWPVQGQTITNPGFESGTTGWTDCPVEINTYTTYGGPGSDHGAEVDGNGNTDPTDDKQLCQTISGFTVGALYQLAFQATRRASVSTPATVVANIQLGSALDKQVSRTGGWDMRTESFTFVPNAISLDLRITPTFTASFGIIFDNFTLTMTSPLPIELLDFEAHALADVVAVDWATASEVDNERFDVERSAAGATWSTIATVPGAGSSQSILHYGIMDRAPLPGVSYYRLRQTDIDGTSTVSDIRAVVVHQRAEHPQPWPQPATTTVNMHVEGNVTAVHVYDALGRAQHVPWSLADRTLTLHLEALPTGNYQVRTEGDVPLIARFMER